jgi:hypothetical protein
VQDGEPQADVEQPEADDDQPHHGSAAEGDLQPSFSEFLAPCAVRELASVAVFMPNQPARPEKNPPVRNANGTQPDCAFESERNDGQQSAHDGEEDRDHFVLAVEIRPGPWRTYSAIFIIIRRLHPGRVNRGVARFTSKRFHNKARGRDQRERTPGCGRGTPTYPNGVAQSGTR